MILNFYQVSNQFWDLLWMFFASVQNFREIYEAYESKVLAYADERGVDRRLLRLSGEEVAGLLDFKRLDRLCTEELLAVKMISQNIFRGDNSTDVFDRYASQIYHEVSVLREEQYKVCQIAPAFQSADAAAYQTIVDEVHESFPRHVHAIDEITRKAQQRLEELLPLFARDRVLLRSVYLFGDEVFDGFYPDGYEDVLALMFPGLGTRKGLLEVAKSFVRAGFVDQALEALDKAQRLPAPDGAPERVALIASVQIEIDDLFAKLKQEQTERAKKRRRVS